MDVPPQIIRTRAPRTRAWAHGTSRPQKLTSQGASGLFPQGSGLSAEVQLGLAPKDLTRLFEQGLVELGLGRQAPFSIDDPLR